MDKQPSLVKFGKELKKLRIDKDCSRKELANSSRVSVSYIAAIERGERNLSLCTLCSLMWALGENTVTLFIMGE